MPGAPAGPGVFAGPGLRLPPRQVGVSTNRRYWVGPRLCGTSDTGYGPGGLRLCATATSLASTTDNAALRPTGDLEIVCRVTAVDWTPGAIQVLVSYQTALSNAFTSYYLYLNTNGTLEFQRPNAAVARTYTSTAAVTTLGALDRQPKWIKVEWRQNDAGSSSCKFFLSDDGTSWSQLGATVTNANTGVANSNAGTLLRMGTNPTSTLPWAGNFHRVTIRDGIGGTVVYDANFDAATPDAASFTESSANAFTVTITTATVAVNTVSAWSEVSNGIGGASAPVASNDVIFDANSGTGTSGTTISGTLTCRSLDTAAFTGGITSSTGTVAVGDAYGGSFVLGTLHSYTSTLSVIFASTSSNNGNGWEVNTAGRTLTSATFSGVGGRWRLMSTLTSSGAMGVTGSGCVVDFNDQAVTVGAMSQTNGRILLKSGLVTLVNANLAWQATAGTIDPGTGIVRATANGTTAITIQVPGTTYFFNDVEIPNGSPVILTGTINCRDFTYYGGARTTEIITVSSATTALNVSDTLTIHGQVPPYRVWVCGTLGVAWVITAANFVSNGYVDWMDVTAAGAAAPFVPTTGDPSMRSYTTAESATGTCNPGFPSGYDPDDMLVAIVSVPTSNTPTAPSGWSAATVVSTSGGSVLRTAVFYARASAVTSTSFAYGSGGNWTATVVAFRDLAYAAPSIGTSASGAAGTATSFNTIGTVSASHYADVAIVAWLTPGGSATPPSGYTEDLDLTGTTAPGVAVATAVRNDATTAATTPTATISPSSSWTTHRLPVPGYGLFGDGGGNTNVTFPASETVYLCGSATTWSWARRWATTAGGTAGEAHVPLPHDDVAMATGGNVPSGTIVFDCPRWGRDIDFTGTTSTGMNTTGPNRVDIFGSIVLTGNTMQSALRMQSNTINLYARSALTIESGGFWWGGSEVATNKTLSLNGPGGSWTLVDDLHAANYAVTLNAGSVALDAFTFTCVSFTESTTVTLAKGIDFDTGTITFWATGTVMALNSTGQTYTADPGSRILVDTVDSVVKDGVLRWSLDNNQGYASWPRTNWQSTLDATTEIDVRVKVTLANPVGSTAWAPLASTSTLASRYFAAGIRSWYLLVNTSNQLVLGLSSDGTNVTASNSNATLATVFGSTAPITAWVRATWRSSDGRVQYFTSPDGSVWTQLGTNQTMLTGSSLMTAPSPIDLGAVTNAASASALTGGGSLDYFDLRTTIDGTPVAVFDPSTWSDYQMSNNDGLGNEWFVRPSLFSAPTIARILGRRLQSGGFPSNYASTPDSVAVSITGDIDLRAKITPNDWTPSTARCINSKWTSAGAFSWVWTIEATGVLRFYASTTGSNNPFVDSSATVPAGAGVTDHEGLWVRVTRRVSDGRVQFFTADASIAYPTGGDWVQLGSDQTLSSGSAIFDGNAPLLVGAYGAGGPSGSFGGQVWYAEVRDGIDGTIAAAFDPSTVEDLARTWTASTGEVWTVTRSAAPAASAFTWDGTGTTIPNLELEIEPGGLHGVTLLNTGGGAGAATLGALTLNAGPKEDLTFSISNVLTVDDATIVGTYAPGGRLSKTRLRSSTAGTKSARWLVNTSHNFAILDIADVWIRGPFETFSGLGSTPPSGVGSPLDGAWWASDPTWVPPAEGGLFVTAPNMGNAGNPYTTSANREPLYRGTGLNGVRPALDFDGANGTASLRDVIFTTSNVTAQAQPYTFIVVFQDEMNGGGATRRVVVGQASGLCGYYRESGTHRATAGSLFSSGVSIDTAPHIAAVVMSNTATIGQMQLDGTRIGSFRAMGALTILAAQMAIGALDTSANQAWDGKIALVFPLAGVQVGDNEAYYDFVKWVSSFYQFPVVDLVSAVDSINGGNNEGWRYTVGMTAYAVTIDDAVGLLDTLPVDVDGIPSDVMGLTETLMAEIASFLSDDEGLADAPVVAPVVVLDDLEYITDLYPCSTLFSDTFTRADAGVMGSTESPVTPWASYLTHAGIKNGGVFVEATPDGADIVAIDTEVTTDFEISCEVLDDDAGGLIVGFDFGFPGPAYDGLFIATAGEAIFSTNMGVVGSAPVVAGDTLKIRRIGDMMVAYVNDVPFAAGTIWFSTGAPYHGLYVRNDGGLESSERIDNFLVSALCPLLEAAAGVVQTDDEDLSDVASDDLGSDISDQLDLTDPVVVEPVAVIVDDSGSADTVVAVAMVVIDDDDDLSDEAAPSYGSEPGDDLGLTDEVAAAADVAASDSAGLSDAAATTLVAAATDALGLTDTTLRVLGLTTTESIELTDEALSGRGAVLDDVLASQDAIAADISGVLASQLGLADSSSLELATAVLDALELTDEIVIVSFPVLHVALDEDIAVGDRAQLLALQEYAMSAAVNGRLQVALIRKRSLTIEIETYTMESGVTDATTREFEA